MSISDWICPCRGRVRIVGTVIIFAKSSCPATIRALRAPCPARPTKGGADGAQQGHGASDDILAARRPRVPMPQLCPASGSGALSEIMKRSVASKLEREPARKQRQDCQDDQYCDDPEEQPRGAIHIRAVISGVE